MAAPYLSQQSVPTVYFVNPRSGGGRGAELLGRPELGTRIKIEPQNIHRQLSTSLPGHERVVVAGGDGTFSMVINAIFELGIQQNTTLHLLPLGTGNDLARSLGIPISPMGAGVESAKVLQQIPVWRYGHRHFVNYLSWGTDPLMLEEVEKYRKLLPKQLLLRKMAFTAAGLRHLGYSFSSDSQLIVNDRAHALAGKTGVIVSNLPYYGGGSRINHLLPKDERLSVSIVKTGAELLRLGLSRYGNRDQTVLPYLEATELRLEGPVVPTQFDGEIIPFTEDSIRLAGHVGIWVPGEE